MDHEEKRSYLIEELLKEEPGRQPMRIPIQAGEQKRLLRALLNVRMPGEISPAFLRVQDEYLSECREEKGVVRLSDLQPVGEGLYLWQGDITRLFVDAIVNAANSGLTGCYQPNHSCIDNCIHTYAGLQLRLECARLMERQGFPEPTGQAKITPGYNLPCKYILHTVGPIVNGRLTRDDQEQLASCYRSCLALAEENGCESIAFCCISTGVFGFPQREAAETAVRTVEQYRAEHDSTIQVVFNVFKDEDLAIYGRLLQ